MRGRCDRKHDVVFGRPLSSAGMPSAYFVLSTTHSSLLMRRPTYSPPCIHGGLKRKCRRSLLRNGLALLRLFKGLAVQVSGFVGSSFSTPKASVQVIACDSTSPWFFCEYGPHIATGPPLPGPRGCLRVSCELLALAHSTNISDVPFSVSVFAVSRYDRRVTKYVYLCGQGPIFSAAILSATRYGTGSLPSALSTVPPAVKQYVTQSG